MLKELECKSPACVDNVLSPSDVDDLVEGYQRYHELQRDAVRYEWFADPEAGTDLQFDFALYADEQELRNDPLKGVVHAPVVEVPLKAVELVSDPLTGTDGVLLQYPAHVRDEGVVDYSAAIRARDQYGIAPSNIAWYGAPAGFMPEVGVLNGEFQAARMPLVEQHERRKANEAAAAKGDFSFARRSPEHIAGPTTDPSFITNIDFAKPQDEDSGLAPCMLGDLLDRLNEAFAHWPRQASEVVFAPNGRGGIVVLNDTNAVMAFYTRFRQRQWKSGGKFVTERQLFEGIRQTAITYDSIEKLPHEPMRRDAFYLVDEVEPGDGSRFAHLVARFCPSTDLDGSLIAAMFATPLIGRGARPAFVIDSPHGRGMGKSTLAHAVSRLYGGHFDVRPNEDIDKLKARMLTPGEPLLTRIAVVDNIKSRDYSSADLEALITAPRISGRRNHVGEASRPNVCYILTLNSAALSTDLAERVVIVQLGRPRRAGAWEEETFAFIERHRMEILGDLVALLRRPPQKLTAHSRWAEWERTVLSRLDQPDALQELIRSRQRTADTEGEKCSLIEELFAARMKSLGLHKIERVHVPNEIAGEWVPKALGERMTKTAALNVLRQLISEGRIERIKENPSRTYGRGFVWTPEGYYAQSTPRYDLMELLASQSDS